MKNYLVQGLPGTTRPVWFMGEGRWTENKQQAKVYESLIEAKIVAKAKNDLFDLGAKVVEAS